MPTFWLILQSPLRILTFASCEHVVVIKPATKQIQFLQRKRRFCIVMRDSNYTYLVAGLIIVISDSWVVIVLF